MSVEVLCTLKKYYKRTIDFLCADMTVGRTLAKAVGQNKAAVYLLHDMVKFSP